MNLTLFVFPVGAFFPTPELFARRPEQVNSARRAFCTACRQTTSARAAIFPARRAPALDAPSKQVGAPGYFPGKRASGRAEQGAGTFGAMLKR
jgi:hypothetical protein